MGKTMSTPSILDRCLNWFNINTTQTRLKSLDSTKMVSPKLPLKNKCGIPPWIPTVGATGGLLCRDGRARKATVGCRLEDGTTGTTDGHISTPSFRGETV